MIRLFGLIKALKVHRHLGALLRLVGQLLEMLHKLDALGKWRKKGGEASEASVIEGPPHSPPPDPWRETGHKQADLPGSLHSARRPCPPW